MASPTKVELIDAPADSLTGNTLETYKKEAPIPGLLLYIFSKRSIRELIGGCESKRPGLFLTLVVTQSKWTH